MANKILVEIDFQGSNAINQAAALTKEIEKFNIEKKVLDENLKSGNITLKDYEVKMQLVNAQQRESQKELRTINKFIDDNIKANKAQEGSIEANRAKLAVLTAEYVRTGKPTKEQTKNIKDLNDTLKKQEAAIGDTRRNVGNYAEALKGIGGPIGGAVNGIQGFNTALAANPILAVVVLIGQLGSALAKLEPVAEFLESAFAGLSAGFNAFIGSIGKFFEGDFAGAFKTFTTGIAEAATESFRLTQATQDLEDAERNAQITLSKNQTLIDQLILQSKNRTVSEEERIKLLERASKIEEENLRIELKNALELVKIQNLKNLQILKTSKLSDEDRQKAIDAQLKVEELQRASIQLQEKITNREDALRDASDAKKQKSFEDEKKRQEKLLKQSQDQIKLKEKQVKDFEDLSKKELDNTLKILEQETKQAELINKERFANGEINEKQYNENISKIKIDALNKQISDLEDYSKTVPGVDLQIAEKRTEIANIEADGKIQANEKTKQSNISLAEQEQQLTNLKLDLATTFVDSISSLLSKDEKNREEFGIALKALALGEIGINLFRELSAIAVASAANPANAVTAGTVGVTQYSIQSAIAIARSVFAAANVATQKLEDGGEINVGGNLHSQGGTKYYGQDGNVFEVERGEKMFVLNRAASAYINKLSGINQMFGGKSFDTPGGRFMQSGGVVADGGFASRSISQTVNDRVAQSNALRNLPVPIVKVSDINRVNESREQAINVSDL